MSSEVNENVKEATENVKEATKKAKKEKEVRTDRGVRINSYVVTIKFIDDILGTVPKDKDIYKTYIASKAPKGESSEENAEDIEELEQKGWTGFFKDENGYYILNHMIFGFIKTWANILKDELDVKAFKSKIRDNCFVGPRKIYFNKFEVDGVNERPLRANTPVGEITALSRSDYFKAGTELEFFVTIIHNREFGIEEVTDVLNFGEFKGLGQNRNNGFGRFEVKSIVKSDKVLKIGPLIGDLVVG
jgi:hypothetical protein